MTGRRILLGFLLAQGLASCAQAAAAPDVGIYKLDDQRISGLTYVIASDGGFSDLDVLVTIDTAGKVVAAEAEDNFERLDPGPGLALVKTWRFKPQTFEGKPVVAIGRVSVEYRERPISPDLSKQFPEGPLAETSITLERGACFGSCPDYRVTIRGNGTVEFDTGDDHFAGTPAEVHLEYNGHNVLLPGHHVARIDTAKVQQLLRQFRDAHFFGLKDEYTAAVTDNPTQKLTVRIGQSSKVLTDYVGTMAGMPEEVRQLENAVDEVAGTERWVSGNVDTLSELDRSNFNYRSSDGEKLALAAATKLAGYRPAAGTALFIEGLIDRGVPLAGPKHLSAVLLTTSAYEGIEPLFDKLAQRGVLENLPRSSLTKAFTGLGCSPSIARKLVQAGADPKATGEGGTALTRIRGSVPSCEERPNRVIELATTLIELGVPLEARDDLGWTALMGCDSPDLARLLIARGADVKAQDKDGVTTVLSTDDDRVALLLLRAGANPRAHDEKDNVRSTAIKRHWPATLAWLDALNVK